MSVELVRADPNANAAAHWPDGPEKAVMDAALASGWEAGQPDEWSADDLAPDREVVEGEPCPSCGGPCEYRPMRRRSDRHGYRALSVCRACGLSSEF